MSTQLYCHLNGNAVCAQKSCWRKGTLRQASNCMLDVAALDLLLAWVSWTVLVLGSGPGSASVFVSSSDESSESRNAKAIYLNNLLANGSTNQTMVAGTELWWPGKCGALSD